LRPWTFSAQREDTATLSCEWYYDRCSGHCSPIAALFWLQRLPDTCCLCMIMYSMLRKARPSVALQYVLGPEASYICRGWSADAVCVKSCDGSNIDLCIRHGLRRLVASSCRTRADCLPDEEDFVYTGCFTRQVLSGTCMACARRLSIETHSLHQVSINLKGACATDIRRRLRSRPVSLV
jgi:hypothetical protein